MTGPGVGLDGRRVYLDWNATAPLRSEARAAMLQAMDTLGNPSSVHSEGRAARAIVENARGHVAALLGAARDEIVFTSGATEAANAVFALGWDQVWQSALEHDAVSGASHAGIGPARVALGLRSGLGPAMLSHELGIQPNGWIDLAGLADRSEVAEATRRLIVAQAANSETGVLQDWAGVAQACTDQGALWACDATAAVGKTHLTVSEAGADFVFGSAHKLGGPKGIGFLRMPDHDRPLAHMRGGGQELGRRSGTENVIGIAGFGAAAAAAKQDLEAGAWDCVNELRNILEKGLEAAASDLIICGGRSARLPNTTCFAVPGWKGETQVMQMDLAGFAVSAGSACSSGKVRESRVLRAMGYDALTAASAIRVSLGPTTTEAEVLAFLDAWTRAYRRRAERAA
ncbi:MAG: cysteine desulfurase family protein [Pseudomonadota bacterium]